MTTNCDACEQTRADAAAQRAIDKRAMTVACEQNEALAAEVARLREALATARTAALNEAAQYLEKYVGVHLFSEVDVTMQQRDVLRFVQRELWSLAEPPAPSVASQACERCDGVSLIRVEGKAWSSEECPDCGGTGKAGR